jgi:hypothetical protein
MDMTKLIVAFHNFGYVPEMLLNSRRKVWSSVTEFHCFKVVLTDVICTVNNRGQSWALFSAS